MADFYTLKITDLHDQKRSPSRFLEDYQTANLSS
jgi:hypothetical protein